MVANFWGANLFGADLRQAKLILNGAKDMSDDYISEVYMSRAGLSGANLSGAKLKGANLTQAQLEEANGDEDTQLPPDLKPPAHWNVKTDEHIEGP